MQNVKEKLTFFCDHCDFVSTSKAHLKKHSISHSTDLQTCGECSQQYASAKGLAQHMGKSHKAEKKECDEKEEIDPNDQVSSISVEQEQDGGNHKKKKGSKKSKKGQSIKNNKQELISQEDGGLSVIKSSRPIHKARKISVFDFWSDGDDELKLMWLEEMGRGITRTTSHEPPCHCRECQPCPHACCENMAVRTGLCCDPTTLGRCLQPYQTECYAPCCHPSVQLRDDYRWVGGELSKVERVKLLNPLEGESQLGNEVLEEYKQVNNIDNNQNNEESAPEEESTGQESFTDESYVPQIYSDQLISKYLDAKLGKVVPKSDFPMRNEFFKIYKDSSLPRGCRIVHKKTLESSRIEFSYRSKCGKFFDTRAGLLSFVANSESSKLDKNANTDLETSSKMFAEGLYQVVKHREGVKKDMMKCVQSYLREDEYAPLENDEPPKFNEKTRPIVLSEADSHDNIRQVRNKSAKINDGNSKMSRSHMNDKIVSQSHHSRTDVYPNLPNPYYEKKSQFLSKVKSKGVVKTVFCEECKETLSLGDNITKHIVVTHPGIEMRSCKICRNRLMNTKSFIKHNKEFHAEEGSTNEGVDVKGILHHNSSNSTVAETSASISSPDQVLSEIGSNIVSVSGNAATTSSVVSNDTFETLDEIENFVKSSARSPHPSKTTISKSNGKSTTPGKKKLPVMSSLHFSNSTPSPIRVSNQKTKKGLVHEGKQVKRARSLDVGLTSSTKKRLRKSLAESLADSEVPLKDTDPEHPTSSVNLRKKGRKNSKKTPMDNLIKSSKYKFILDTTRTINDIVEGEVLVTQSAKPECYFRIGSKHQLAINSLRKIGRDLKVKKPQQRIQSQKNPIHMS